MNNLMAFFAFVAICGTILSLSFEGEQPLITTVLAATIDSDDVIIPVSSTDGFPTSGRIVIEGEHLDYTGVDVAPNCSGEAVCFTGATRAADQTTAILHGSGIRVYNESLGVFNQAQAFRLRSFNLGVGSIDVPWVSPLALTKFVLKVITWDYFWFHGDWVILRVILVAVFSTGFVWTLFAILSPVFVGIARLIPGL